MIDQTNPGKPGPRSAEGKQTVSWNAAKHYLSTSRHVVVAEAGESQQEFDELLAALHAEWNPQGPTESHYLRQAAEAEWRIRRANRKESQLLRGAPGDLAAMNLLDLYRARNQRAFDRAVNQLRALRADALKQLQAELKLTTESLKADPARQPLASDLLAPVLQKITRQFAKQTNPPPPAPPAPPPPSSSAAH